MLAAFCWSCGFIIARPLLGRLSVFKVNALRLYAPAAVFPILVLLLGWPHLFAEMRWYNFAALAGTAVLGIGLADLGMINAMRVVGVSRAYTLATLATLFGVFWAWLLLGESITLSLLLAALVMMIGVTLSTVRGGGQQGEAAYGLVLLRIGLGDSNPLVANAFRLPVAALVGTTALLIREPRSEWLHWAGLSHTARGLSAGVVGIGCGALLFMYALGEIGAARAGVIASLSPVFGMILATAFLGERPSPWQAVGVFMAVGGVVLVTLS